MGYCNVARVLSTGPSCKHVSVGDRILTFQSHRSHFIACESEILSFIPESLESQAAVNAYLFHLGYSAILSSNYPAGAKVAIIGLGVLGLTSAIRGSFSGWDISLVSDQSLDFDKLVGKSFHQFSRSAISNSPDYDCVIITSNSWADWDLALKISNERQDNRASFPCRSENDP